MQNEKRENVLETQKRILGGSIESANAPNKRYPIDVPLKSKKAL